MPTTAVPDPPDLGEYLLPFLEGFWALASSRNFSMAGALPIPVSEIMSYHENFDIGDREEFLFLIQQLDTEWMNLVKPKK